jgi:hypothetical protein
MCGNGSKRASAFRIDPDGGSTVLSSLRITERWIGVRSWRAPGVWSATEPAIQTKPRASAATSTAPPIPSITPRGCGIRRRSRKPSTSRPDAKIPPIRIAPISADRGA